MKYREHTMHLLDSAPRGRMPRRADQTERPLVMCNGPASPADVWAQLEEELGIDERNQRSKDVTRVTAPAVNHA